MVSKEVTVVNPSGLHLRPAGNLSQTALRFKSDIVIECKDRRVIAKSVLNVMAAGIKCGTKVKVVCDGLDEDEALRAVCEAIKSGLGETGEK
ncbi:MAG: HPr family phosphocarrier protein [Eubacteriales bacterium]|nr:HPr family phosphocarrier protein [Eubacteriales bacterium]